MQERRTLFYMDLDDIPSSAHVPIVNDTFNVAYIPIGKAGGYVYATRTGSLDRDTTITYTLDPNMFGTSNFLSSTIYKMAVSISHYVTIGNNFFGYRMSGDSSKTYLLHFMPYFTYTGNTSVTPIYISYTKFIGYVKISFNNYLKISNVQSLNPEHPIYIDTEE